MRRRIFLAATTLMVALVLWLPDPANRILITILALAVAAQLIIEIIRQRKERK